MKLDENFTSAELEQTLKACNESAPGPDGITYKYYEVFWDVLGKFLLEAWEFSISIGQLPLSQRQSTITLLPKEGKDIKLIGNWRPITLTNCDLKVITKTIANRTSKILDKIISPTQTAYIPGRVVHDNLRMFEFYKKYCHENNVEAVLMSLDAKKAFDSVDHGYMFATLKFYGFSESFINTVRILYRDIEADILVNGHRTTFIKILRCVKQGDAFSCALFIICIDPLLRNIERNKKIVAIELVTPLSNKRLSNKTGAFADDVGTLTKGDTQSLNEVFTEYRRFSSVSGIELNESKTEILKLGGNPNYVVDTIRVTNGIKTFEIKCFESIKICGLTFSNNINLAYEQNISNKLVKLERKLLAWQYRGLSLGGKILISKTFGYSQLIYSLQATRINNQDLRNIEAFIFKFLWSKNVSENKAPDRIKRTIMKRDYPEGGLRVVDFGALDKALKLKQFFRACDCNHPIKLIQKYILEGLDYDNEVYQDYNRFTHLDDVVNSAQNTINELTNISRREVDQVISNNGVVLPFQIDLIASIDISNYLDLKRQILLKCYYKTLFRCGIESFKQLVMEATYPRSDNFERLAVMVLKAFPSGWVSLVRENIECNGSIVVRDNVVLEKGKVYKIESCSVGMIKKGLLREYIKDPFPFETKLGITQHEGINPFTVARIVNHSVNLKIFKFRLLHMDIFSKERMFKFKMTQNDNCDHCGLKETVKHVLWDCARAREVWNRLEVILRAVDIAKEIKFENIFIGYSPTDAVLEGIITRVTQILLRIDRENGIEERLLRYELIQLARQYVKVRLKSRADKDLWLKIVNTLNTDQTI